MDYISLTKDILFVTCDRTFGLRYIDNMLVLLDHFILYKYLLYHAKITLILENELYNLLTQYTLSEPKYLIFKLNIEQWEQPKLLPTCTLTTNTCTITSMPKTSIW